MRIIYNAQLFVCAQRVSHFSASLCTALQSVIYDLVAAAFITGEDRHVILILSGVSRGGAQGA